MIDIHLIREHYKEALDILKTQVDDNFGAKVKFVLLAVANFLHLQNIPELFYKYSPKLVRHISMELFACLIGNERVRPQRMLPTLCLCQETTVMVSTLPTVYVD